jgi:pimeloyl-ACP methyl ester carboxylesterase
MLTAASPTLLSTRIKLDVLKEQGYAAWRSSRLRTLSDIQSVKIVFSARLPEGGSERQSGTAFVPVARRGQRQTLSWVIFAKGTELRRDYTPSRGKGLELPFITALAALGYAVWVPDYSGMGDGQGVHEYCMAESLADSALDGLAAARTWLAEATTAGEPAYSESGRLAIMGYSEGGLTVMGTLEAIADERIPTPGLRLEAVYPMGAPLNLAIVASDLGEAPYVLTHPEYQVYIGLGWERACPGELKLTDIFLTRTIDSIVPLFDGRRRDTEINRRIATIVGKKAGSVIDADIFSPEYLSALRRDPASSSYYRIQAHARLDNWTPPEGIPIILAATPIDDIVPFGNSQNEYDWAKEHAPLADVSLVRLASAGHINAGIEAYLYAIVDFDRREASLSRQ